MISTFRYCIKKVPFGCRMSSNRVREARMLEKMINKGLAPKKPKKKMNCILSKGFFFSPDGIENNSIRISSLNKAYMEHVTEIINSGSCAKQLADFQIEVTKVSLCKNFNFLNIYYISKKDGTSDKILRESLGELLAELQAKMGELRYLGKVPYLKLIRDKMLENSIQLEKIFQAIDLGRDYEPIYKKKVLTSDHPANNGLPKMRQNLFGIDVAKIKEKIKAEIIRYKINNIKPSENDPDPEHEYPEKLMKFSRKDFFKFFKRRRIAEMKRRKIELREMNSLQEEFGDIPNPFEDDSEFEEDEGYIKDDNE